MNPYLDPPCRPSTLDSFGNRRLILAALRANLKHFSGSVLDIGCGHMPYKDLLLSPPSAAVRYTGIDLPGNPYSVPDQTWDGKTIPAGDGSVDSVLLTEVLEHCPDPARVLAEIFRVLRPGGFLFLTVPFIWPMHTVPHDEYRYTPFALRRLLEAAGFPAPVLKATGGRDAVLGATLGLWVRRGPGASRYHQMSKRVLSVLLWPLVWWLFRIDVPSEQFDESTMIVGLSAAAFKPL